MSEQRWTAPQDGYYRFGHSPEPEYLGTERTESEPTDGTLTILGAEHWVTGPAVTEAQGLTAESVRRAIDSLLTKNLQPQSPISLPPGVTIDDLVAELRDASDPAPEL